MENQSQNFDEKFQVKTEIEHILDRSGMWIGSTSSDVVNYPLFVPSKNKITLFQNIGHNAGLLKLIDEVLSNSIDEHRRKDSLFKVTKIDVIANNNGFIIIKDNGGIPVQVHKATGLLIPELIFGYLRTSSNYDDSQEREVVGTNGLGAKLTNIFSKVFTVQTCDNKKSVCIEWKNNMRESNKDLEKYPKGFYVKDEDQNDKENHGTRVSFQLDLERFEIDELGLHTIRILQKRCIDAAAANPGLLITFESDIAEGRLNSEWQFNSFEEYVKLYLTDEQIPTIIKYNNKRDQIIIIPDNINFNIGFVNGALCCEGTHIKKIEKQLSEKLLDVCSKNEMELITEKDILNRISIFVNTVIPNPTYDSQTKTKLTNKIDKYILNFTIEFLNSLQDSKIMENLKLFYEVKYAEQKRKELKQLNGLLKSTKTKKLISCVSNVPDKNELWLFEGDSASNGFRKHRNLFQACYLLRGKITNTFNLDRTQILENIELREVIATAGLLFGEPQKNVKNCKYSKLVFGTDMDHDGNHICGLLLAFFGRHFSELIKAGKVYRALSPIVICNPEKKGLIKKYFYTLDEFELEKNNLKGYDIIYTKGLGGLADEDYKQMLRQEKLIQFTMNDLHDIEAIKNWFDKSTEIRKQIILEDSGEAA
jgi:DNA gyrase/topoisomerase IV subunit B